MLLLFAFVLSITANAQEAPVDIVDEVAIEETPAPELEQPVDLPLGDAGGIVVEEPIFIPNEPIRDTRDDIRLQIMSAQALSYESTGEYTQISKQAQVVDGDSITFDAVKDTLFTGKEEVHVYEAPCGRGWQLLVHDIDYGYITSSSTGKTEYAPYPVFRSYGYGCEHDSRTTNW